MNTHSGIELSEFTASHIEQALRLWRGIAGIGLSEADSAENLGRFLARNPHLSAVARRDAELVGAVLCGHDGRRGYIHHLAVAPGLRRSGIGRQLLEWSLARLREIGIGKCHALVFRDNAYQALFWKTIGWQRRDDLNVYSKKI